jgi:hypothetical protein
MMNNFIINSFILKKKYTLNDIYNYLYYRHDKSIDLDKVKEIMAFLIKNEIVYYNNMYELTNKGNVILNDHKYYYSKIIYKFFMKNYFIKKYQLKEIRQEQQKFRNYLIHNKSHSCILCDKKLPLCLLETAHLKPRCILNKTEMNDINVVEFMCRYCHTLYDNGHLSIDNGLLQVSEIIHKYDLNYKIKKIECYNLMNENYFIFHYNFIFKNNS